MYLLEGNIGVGKSTFLSLLGQLCPEIVAVQEPVTRWSSAIDGSQLLENFYKDPQRWSFTMETMTMSIRVQEYVSTMQNHHPNRVMERSVYSGHYCFALNGYMQGNFNGIEWDIYSRWVDFLMHTMCRPPRGFIYLQASSEVCYDRMKLRAREGEETVPLAYLKQIELLHNRFLITKEGLPNYLASVPVLIIDATLDYKDHPERMQQHAERVRDFFAQTQSDAALTNRASSFDMMA